MKFRRALPWMGLIVTAVMITSGLGFFYLSSQRLRLDEENRREVAHVGHDLENILGGLSVSAENFFQQPRAVLDFARRNPYVDLDRTAAEPAIADQQVSGLACPAFETPEQLRLKVQPGAGPYLALDAGHMLDDVVISDAIAYLFIANSAGKVMFARQNRDGSSQQDGPTWLDRQSREPADEGRTTVRLTELASLRTPDGKPVDPKQLAQASAVYSVELGASGYEMFSYPITVPQASGCPASAWIVGGLVDPRNTWREAAAILSPRLTLVLLLALLLCFTAKPFVKLILLGPGERFHFSDGCMLLPAGTILLALSTVLLLEASAHRSLDARAHGALQSLASGVEDRLTYELGKMAEQLAAFDHHAAKQAGAFPEKDVNDLLTAPPGPLTICPDIYPDVWSIAWLDEEGKQIFKEDVHGVVAPRMSLQTRPYFREPLYRPADLWSLPGHPSRPFFVESLRTYTTGELTTVLSMPSEITASGNRIAMISSSPLTVRDPLLPAGYDFAVISADGQVLYHSDSRRTLKEDFFAEAGDAAMLHAAIEGDQPQFLTTTYGRSPVDMYVRRLGKLRGAAWFIVTMRDRQWVEAVSTEALLGATVWTVASWLAVLAAAIGLLWAGRKSLRYWWPDPRQIGVYRMQALLYGALLAGGILSVVFWRTPANAGLFWFSITYPLWSMAATVVAYRSRARTDSAAVRSTPGWASWYLAALAGLWITAAVVPASGLFRHSWRLQLSKLDQFETNRENARERDWIAKDRDFYRSQNISAPEKFFSARAQRTASFRLRYSDDAAVRPPAPDLWLDRHLPFYDEQVKALRFQSVTAQGSLAQQPEPLAAMPLNDTGGQSGSAAIGAIGFACVAFLAVWWLRFNVRTLFWTHLDAHPEQLQSTIAANRLVLVVAPSERDKHALRALLQKPRAVAAAAPELCASQDSIAAEVFDFEEDSRTETARALEDALRNAGGRAVLLASADPLMAIPALNWPAEEKERWIGLLQPFVKVDAPIVPGAPSTPAYFDSLWQHCSKDEQLALVHISREGFANPHSAGAVEGLLRKGLLSLAPNLQLMNSGFAGFVASRACSAQVKQWERPAEGLGWRGMRIVFLGILVAAMALVAATGEAWIQGAATMATGLAAGLEAFWKLLNAAQRPAGG